MKLYHSVRRSLAVVGSFITQFVCAAELPNAWEITDMSSSAGGGSYNANLPPDLQSAALSNGWRYTIRARLVDDFNDTATMVFLYGVGTNRFSVFLDLDGNDDLTATPFNQPTLTLTTNGTGAAMHHTYDIVYDPGTGRAAFFFDGVQRTTWDGDDVNAANGLISWGSGSSAGQGRMRFHTAAFAIGTNVVTVYDAGFQGSPAPDPRTQGWNAAGTSATTTNGVSPDITSLPSPLMVTTLAPTNVRLHTANLRGSVNLGGLAASAWIEWGVSTNYENSSAPQFLKATTNATSFSLSLTGLPAGTTYYFRCVASNVLGAAYGEDVEFSTPASWAVTTLADSGPGSLRQAIADSESGDTITFFVGGRILLTSGQLNVSNSITIAGYGAAHLRIDGGGNSRVFRILSGTTNRFSGITITNGQAPVGLDGGGIHNAGTLTLNSCLITANRAGNGANGVDGADGVIGDPDGEPGTPGGNAGDGGGIYNLGSLTLIACTVYNNIAGMGGQGGQGGTAAIFGDGGNGGRGGASGSGAGIYNGSPTARLSLSNCTIYANFTGGGGQGGRGGTPFSLGSTPGAGGSGGPGGHGGGIFNTNSAALSLTACTLAHNGASLGGGGGANGAGIPSTQRGPEGKGGGIFTVSDVSITLRNTFIGNHRPDADLWGTNFLSYGHNLVSYNTNFVLLAQNATDIVPLPGTYTTGVEAVLRDVGGPTPTAALLSSGLAIDAGDDTLVSILPTDQRGAPRLSGAHVDIGAYEAQSVVLNTNDSGPGSLREVLYYGFDTITFAPALSGQTIRLTSGQLTVSRFIFLDASALAGGIVIDAGGNSRVLGIAPGAFVVLNSLTLKNGSAFAGGGILVDGFLTLNHCTLSGHSATFGGAISSSGTLTLSNSIVTGNFASQNTGGIENNGGVITIVGSLVSSNSANYGGGFGNWSGGTLLITNSTFTANSATERGGAGYNVESVIFIHGSTFFDNSARSGGAVYCLDSPFARFNNSTLAGNRTTERGAGIVNNASALTINNGTLSGNQAGTEGGGIVNSGGTLTMTNTIVAGNSASSNANTSGTFAGANNFTNGAPQLGPLGDYGGPTRTMLPLSGSPVIDAGRNSVTNFLPTDQRGYRRRSGASVDIGAVEVQQANTNNLPWLTQHTVLAGGALQFFFTNDPAIAFSVYAATNVAAPAHEWIRLGTAAQPSPGQYQYTDLVATNYPHRFYRVTWP
jgi:hypothetical protein